MLEEKLTKIGFSLPEAKVYSTLIRFPGLLAGVLAKKVNMSRSSVYSVLDSLIKKGLVSVSYEGRVKYFVAEGLEKLEEFFVEEEKRLNQRKKDLNQLLSELQQIKDSQIDRPEVTFYEGSDSVKSLFKNIAANNKDVYLIGDWQDLIADSKIHIVERLKRGNKMTMITRDTPLARKQKKEDKKVLRRQYLVDSNNEMPATVSVGENHLAIYTLDPGFPIGIRIRNQKIIKTVLTLFKLAIKGSRKP